MSELDKSQRQAVIIYSEWRQSLSYGKHSYRDIANSIGEAIERCRAEIAHVGVRDSVIEQWKFMQSRVSEFTVDGEVEADDFPACLMDTIKYSASCRKCGRAIADYEEKLPVCIDCRIGL